MKKLEWTTKKIKVSDLIELEFNPRKISEEKKKKLIASIEKFNLVEIPAVNTDMKIIGGNQRVKAMIIAGRGNEMIDVRVPNRELTEKEVKEYNLISNSHAGEFDLDVIMSEFKDIDFDEIGFGLESFKDLFEDDEERIREQNITPFKRTHVLFSFSPEKMIEIQEYIEKIKNIEGVEYEQASN